MRAYEGFRANDRDVDRIAAHLVGARRHHGGIGFPRHEIADIKDHLMRRTQRIEDQETGVVSHRRYDVDEDIAAAWIRLRSGRPEPDDLVLLEHEAAEIDYLRRHPAATYREAHAYANARFNWGALDLPRIREDLDSDW